MNHFWKKEVILNKNKYAEIGIEKDKWEICQQINRKGLQCYIP